MSCALKSKAQNAKRMAQSASSTHQSQFENRDASRVARVAQAKTSLRITLGNINNIMSDCNSEGSRVNTGKIGILPRQRSLAGQNDTLSTDDTP